MVDIDERVVQMKFDSSDFEQKSKSTLSILDKLREKLSFKDVSDSDNLSAITDNVQKMADKAYTIVDRMVDKIKDNIANKLVSYLQENTIGQLKSGWSKYADMTTSVATLKGQGYAMEKITEQLERLNYFTDETSYQFTAMVGEIGKFTASGQSLDDATTAMMGIANWAAASGKNASEASRAMYQLSQALGAGTMRLIDYKSIQNLNMDTIEFRKNAIEAAIAVGTLKDNLDGTFTSLVDNKTTFTIQNFAESLSGKWFNSKVMMKTYTKYSEAVDDVRAVFEEGSFLDAEGLLHTGIGTTAEALKIIKKNNQDLLKKFEKTDLDTDSINKLLTKWKKVEKVTDMTVAEYAEIYEISENQAKLQMEESQKSYAEYLKEYAEVFKGTEKDAEEALESWKTYVSEYGIEAFAKSQEAKTFKEAIESAMDAASTVWTTIYTNVFGNYEEAKEIWTDLANALYEIFVDRLWDLNSIFEYWRSGGKSAMEAELKEYEKELKALKSKDSPTEEELARIKEIEAEMPKLEKEIDRCFVNGRQTTKTAVQEEIKQYEQELEELTAKTANGASAAESQRIDQLKSKIEELNEAINQNAFVDGRRQLFQGLYAFGAGLKSIIFNFRDAWDETASGDSAGEKLLSFSERLRVSAFRFYDMMTNEETGLASTTFYQDIAQGIRNLFAPLKGVIEVIRSVIASFMPAGTTFVQMLANIARKFRELTAKIVPSQETLQKIARILRGLVALVKFIGKVIYGVYTTTIKPILTTIYNVLSAVFGAITSVLADLGDQMYALEEGMGPLESMYTFASLFGNVLSTIWEGIKRIASLLLKIFGPLIGFAINSVKKLAKTINELFSGGENGLIARLDRTIDRIRNAWKSTETLADVFNRFKGGTGISNFIEMLGAMLTNLIERIGKVIAALFGFDEAVAQSGIKSGLTTIQDAFKQFGVILSWLLTNVIGPTLKTIFGGIAVSIKELGEAWKNGDITKILEILKNFIKTVGALEIVKLIFAFRKVLGSGGILKIIKNTAKTIKAIGNYFNKKALNQTASAMLKFAIAVTIVTTALIGLSYLPDNQFDRVKYMLLGIAVGLTTIVTIIALISYLAGSASNVWEFFKADPIESAARMFLSLTASIIASMLAIYLLKKAFDSMSGWDLVGFAAAVLAPFVTMLLVLVGVTKIVKKANIVGTLGGIAGIIAAIAGSVLALSLGLKILTNIFADENKTAGQIWAAFAMLVILVSVVSLVSALMIKVMSGGKIIFVQKSAKALALTVVAILAATALIVLPALEDLVQDSDKFPQYILAVALFSTLMLAIGGAINLMTKNIGGEKTKFGGIKLLAAGIVFAAVAKVMKDSIVPAIINLSQLGFTALNALPGVLVVGLAVLALAKAIQWICTGLSRLFITLSTVKPMQFIAIGLSIAIVIGAIMGLAYLFQVSGVSLDVGFIIAAVASIIAILVALGLFGKIMSKELSNELAVKKLNALFTKMTMLVSVIMLGFIGVLAVINLAYKENINKSIEIIQWFTLGVAGVLIVALGGMFLVFNNLFDKVKVIDSSKIHQISKMLKITFLSLAAIIGLFAAGSLLGGLIYSNSEHYISTITYLAIGIMATVATFLAMMTIYMKEVSWYVTHSNDAYNKEMNKLLLFTLGGLIAIIASISFMLMPALKKVQGVAWESVIASLAGISLVIATVLGMTTLLTRASSAGKVDFVGLIAGLGGFIVTLVSIAIVVPLILEAFNKIRGLELTDLLYGLGAVMGPLAGLLWLISTMSAPGVGELFLSTCMKITSGLLLVAAAVSAVGLAFTMIRELIEPGTTFLSGYRAVQGFANGMIKNKDIVTKATEEAITDNVSETTTEDLDENSPSKLFKKYGKYVDVGFAQGITKNNRVVEKASEKLADLTSDTFAEELQIQSPSKVFYEHGRFVVRGFVNGLNDESNKNKQAGSDMAEGFSEGMSDALEKTKTDFAGLWSDFGMDADIQKALSGFGSDAGNLLSNTLLDNLFGGDGDEITQAEREEYKIISNQFTNAFNEYRDKNEKYQKALEKVNKAQAKYNENKFDRNAKRELDTAQAALQDVENDLLQKFLTENDNKLKKDANKVDYRGMYERMQAYESKLGKIGKSAVTNGLINAFTGAAGDQGLLDTIGGIGSTLFGGLFGSLGFDTSEGAENPLTQFGNWCKDNFGEGGKYNPGDLFKNGVDTAVSYITGDKGTELTDSISTVVKDGFDKGTESWWNSTWVKGLFDIFYGEGNQSDNERDFRIWFAKNQKEYGLDENSERGLAFKNLVLDAIQEFGDEGRLDEERFKQYAESFNELGDKWKYATFYIFGGLDHIVDDLNKTDDLKGFWTNPDAFKEGGGAFYLNDAGKALEAFDEFANNLKKEGIEVDRIKFNDTELANLIYEKQEYLDDRFLAIAYSNALKSDNSLIKKSKQYSNGKTYVTLSDKGVFFLKEMLKRDDPYNLSSDDIIKKWDEQEKEREEYNNKVSNSAGQIEQQVNNLLTTNDWEGVGHLTDDQITQLITDLDNLGLLGTDDFGNFTLNDPQNNFSTIVSLLRTITNYVVKKDPQIFEKTELEYLKENKINYADLRYLSQTGGGTELRKLTGGLDLEQYTEYLQNRYSDLIDFMEHDIDYITATDEQKEYYKQLRKYYEKNFWQILDIKTDGPAPPAPHSSAKDEAEKPIEEQKRKEEEERRKKAEAEAKEKARQDALNSIKKEYNVKDISKFEEFIAKAQKELPSLTDEIAYTMNFFDLAMEKKWIEIDKNGKVLAGVFAQDTIDIIKEIYGIASPSKEMIKIMKFLFQGMQVGIDQYSLPVLSNVADITSLIIGDTVTALEAMENAIEDEDVKTSFTPIYEDYSDLIKKMGLVDGGNGMYFKYGDPNDYAKMRYVYDGKNFIVSGNGSTGVDDGRHIIGLSNEDAALIADAIVNSPDKIATPYDRYKLLFGDQYTRKISDIISGNKAWETEYSFIRNNANPYNGAYELLGSSNKTNDMLNTLIGILENGDVTNVNVQVEPVPGNIYDVVISENHNRFRRTGVNGFLSG